MSPVFAFTVQRSGGGERVLLFKVPRAAHFNRNPLSKEHISKTYSLHYLLFLT